ncbi:hypothetical protein, unlikely [Trypanosoma brucei gambiense DAL972]|uniref:Uncharacterized protein n=1 Tax=Trypanosoma brucei gambiense (strain MHOM/CI/86/DAL972) TaxID=679716 RepID=D0A7Y0_TRYB9|nr:hypothetical protein, unlikely [Trypanosoma brucei gambiense DAL972]CBH17781.1 hypothetical protein, unlikely [Trypanosoma brucei gambiense DAL972]|eukprot:XP_011780045.1 hypothetical protein, unlikely [Trypanosoma brucei gambiense DAL972]
MCVRTWQKCPGLVSVKHRCIGGTLTNNGLRTEQYSHAPGPVRYFFLCLYDALLAHQQRLDQYWLNPLYQLNVHSFPFVYLYIVHFNTKIIFSFSFKANKNFFPLRLTTGKNCRKTKSTCRQPPSPNIDDRSSL